MVSHNVSQKGTPKYMQTEIKFPSTLQFSENQTVKNLRSLNGTNQKFAFETKSIVSNFGPVSTATSQTCTAAAQENIRKEPAEEFFAMMLLSHKMKNQKNPMIMALDNRKMYQAAVSDQKLSFLEFQEFLDFEINKIKMV